MPRGKVDGSRLAHGEVVGEVQMAERSPEVEGSRPENDRIGWRNPDRNVLEHGGMSWNMVEHHGITRNVPEQTHGT